jgi:hypothetical protein
MILERAAARGHGRGDIRFARNRSAAAHDGDEVPPIAVRGNRHLPVAHLQRLALAEDEEALQHIRIVRIVRKVNGGTPVAGGWSGITP